MFDLVDALSNQNLSNQIIFEDLTQTMTDLFGATANLLMVDLAFFGKVSIFSKIIFGFKGGELSIEWPFDISYQRRSLDQ